MELSCACRSSYVVFVSLFNPPKENLFYESTCQNSMMHDVTRVFSVTTAVCTQNVSHSVLTINGSVHLFVETRTRRAHQQEQFVLQGDNTDIMTKRVQYFIVDSSLPCTVRSGRRPYVTKQFLGIFPFIGKTQCPSKSCWGSLLSSCVRPTPRIKL